MRLLVPGSRQKPAVTAARWLSRLLAQPVATQVLTYAYFWAALDAVVAKARDVGKFDDGVGEVPGRVVSFGDAAVLHQPPGAPPTLVRTMRVDRGLSYEQAAHALEHHAAAAWDGSAFYVSRHAVPGTRAGRSVLLALGQPRGDGGTGMAFSFVLHRPNTGRSGITMQREDVARMYERAPPGSAWVRGHWAAQHAQSAASGCPYGAECVSSTAGGGCSHGKRLLDVSLVCGAVVRAWGAVRRLGAKNKTGTDHLRECSCP